MIKIRQEINYSVVERYCRGSQSCTTTPSKTLTTNPHLTAPLPTMSKKGMKVIESMDWLLIGSKPLVSKFPPRFDEIEENWGSRGSIWGNHRRREINWNLTVILADDTNIRRECLQNGLKSLWIEESVPKPKGLSHIMKLTKRGKESVEIGPNTTVFYPLAHQIAPISSSNYTNHYNP